MPKPTPNKAQIKVPLDMYEMTLVLVALRDYFDREYDVDRTAQPAYEIMSMLTKPWIQQCLAIVDPDKLFLKIQRAGINLVLTPDAEPN